MDIAGSAIRRKVVTLVLVFAALLAGTQSYLSMGRLEDPEFTIKDALVITPYPGATATEVEQEVSDEMEMAVQQLGQLDMVVSRSDRGLSTLTVSIQDKYDKSTLPQVWDELRRKVGDAQGNLPPGAGPSIVVDDYGDVYGVFVVVYGAEYSYAELKTVTDWLQRELLLVQDVAKIAIFGERRECVYVELDRDRMAQLQVPEEVILAELRSKNLVTDTGHVQAGPEFIAINPTGGLDTVEEFGDILIRGLGSQIYLRDVAQIRRGYVEPMSGEIRFDGNPGIALGISTVSGGNVVEMGEALVRRMDELWKDLPLGVEFGAVSVQSDSVTAAISNFVISLIEAVVIVIGVLVFFMGMRSALLIGFVLVLTIMGSFIFLKPMGVALERISLGALIIALGMLVDNAIVVVDGMLVRIQAGQDRKKAASSIVKQSGVPLLGATLVAIMAFAAIGTSQDSTGEFCRSLFQVIGVSLLLSWVTAVTVTPLLGVMFLKPPSADAVGSDPYDTALYRGYRRVLARCIRFRWVTVGCIAGVFAVSLVGFTKVEQSFFPPSTRPQFMTDIWMPQGTHFDRTAEVAAEVEQYLLEQEGVTHVTSSVGKGALRFLLTYGPERPNPAYAQFFASVESPEVMGRLLGKVEDHLNEAYPDALSYTSKFILGPGSVGKVQARFSGPDPDVLRDLATATQAIYHADLDSKGIRNDWRQRTKVVRPQIIDEVANSSGVRRPDVSAALRRAFQGEPVGIYREDDLLLPIMVRSPEPDRLDVASLENLTIWSPVAGQMIPIRQVVRGFKTVYEDEIVQRRNRRRTITVFCDPVDGPANELFQRVRPQVEALDLPAGYVLEWGGEYEDSGDAQAALFGRIPMFVALMVLITIALFNSLRQPLVIWMCVPLALIGVTAGLLSTGQPFGFMALLGFLSLMGMLIKNAIVLVDQINVETAEGKSTYDAIVNSGVSRLRPVAMAAATTVLGMVPLLVDAFFASMAVTIIFGLMLATILTMVVLPVFYSIVFRAKSVKGA
jgi:multidrug efflux pump subunit AcrB